ncbi:MAG: aromatic ring-hydroxylating dioxygenase subunit alpha [Pseudomonas sp.]|uniref:aromatic ring-hydroxylating oxygenase subunit alpha n=1 Tax=Pseudomonas sp. TaxID=306 RepID=UPI00120373BA|nr:aromatic ring-hydroxylating dioxygenase subunit alpha [Pseudomonas sp.]RZI68162.1 MAG: aromatic ring-hydroxylating dioxygenase subunit alpha [Pseudomonas sp.]
MAQIAPGDWIRNTVPLDELDFDALNLKIPVERYSSLGFQEHERTRVWMIVWQIVGRADELPQAGDWKVYTIFDQSFIIVRGRDEKIRGFVNACRHRGNALCEGKGRAKRFTCPYHLWTFGIDGKLQGVGRPDLVGSIDKDAHGLVEVPVDTFAGFIFLNPDPDAKPLAEALGRSVIDGLSPYKLDEMTPVGMDVREELNCNWKVVMDAFSEGYHIIGVHPELLSVIDLQAGNSRHGVYGDHGMAVSPFEVKNTANCSVEQQVQGVRDLPGTFPTVAEVLPMFEQMVNRYRDAAGELMLPKGVTVRTLLQQATRETLTLKGLDVSGLSDDQMGDSQGWFLFPNFFMTIRAGEATTIMAFPHPDGDPNRCVWHVTAYMWLPTAFRAEHRTDLVEVTEPGTYPYFLALQQDYDQMQRQQVGLRNRGMKHISLIREEASVARFHAVLDRYLADPA